MKRIITVLTCAILVASCATTPRPILGRDAAVFHKSPEVVVIDGRRFLTYQVDPDPSPVCPAVMTKVVEGEVLCYVSTFISANHLTGKPRKRRIPDGGPVYWLNPDGTKIRLDSHN